MVEVTPSSQLLFSLSFDDRIKALNRVILAARTSFTLSRPKEEEFSVQAAEAVLSRYLSLGYLEKHTGPFYSNLALLLLSNHTVPVFPLDLLKATGEISVQQLGQAFDPSSAQLYALVLTFIREAVQWDWISKEVGGSGLSNAVMNYRVSKKQFNRCLSFLAGQLC
jgi:hypothetical protein